MRVRAFTTRQDAERYSRSELRRAERDAATAEGRPSRWREATEGHRAGLPGGRVARPLGRVCDPELALAVRLRPLRRKAGRLYVQAGAEDSEAEEVDMDDSEVLE